MKSRKLCKIRYVLNYAEYIVHVINLWPEWPDWLGWSNWPGWPDWLTDEVKRLQWPKVAQTPVFFFFKIYNWNVRNLIGSIVHLQNLSFLQGSSYERWWRDLPDAVKLAVDRCLLFFSNMQIVLMTNTKMRFRSLSGVIRSLIGRYIVAHKTANFLPAPPAIKGQGGALQAWGEKPNIKQRGMCQLQFRGEPFQQKKMMILFVIEAVMMSQW